MFVRTILALLLLALVTTNSVGQSGAHRPIELVPQSAHTKALAALAYSPDGSLLASASTDGTIRVWDANGKALLRIIRLGGVESGKTQNIQVLGFTANNERLIALAEDGIRRDPQGTGASDLVAGEIKRLADRLH